MSSTVPTGFTFELGTFASGFTPAADNTGQWAANFLTSGIDGNIITWTNLENGLFPTFGEALGTSAFRPDGDVVQGDQAFFWGYNSMVNAVSSEWILLTNPVWLFPEGDARRVNAVDHSIVFGDGHGHRGDFFQQF